MSFTTIRIDTDERGVATLALARPDKHNAMSSAMITELGEAAARIAGDARIRVVVLTGEGESFCAGGDLGWMREQAAATRAQRMEEARKLARALRALNELPKPVIGKVNGQSYGGGMGLISVCDVAIAADQAKFGFTEVRLGLIPATISPYCLARMGEGRARRVFFSGRIFGAGEAHELGLIARAVPADELDDAVEAEIKPYLAASPQAVAAGKKLARFLGPTIDDSIMEDTVGRLADTWETTDMAEGIAAFFEKRKPAWQK
ncbi:MAG: crotonase/enoyl-CoA hydratase family protein [Rhizobiaceae bacterium]|nr:crotonase/enoyl-CoA hydratase family protein [Rhizobiaceae bacterium]MCB1464720.1 crotonase/enoyl-CoA hydratase family protein [Nitratireductor sp.]